MKWESRFKSDDGIKAFSISGRRPGLTDFEVTDPEPSDMESTGTVVEVRDLHDKLSILDDSEKIIRELAQRFALYLREYPKVEVTVDGARVDQTEYENSYAEYDLPAIELSNGITHEAKLVVIEWSIPFNRAVYFCNADGFTLTKRP